ncbi:acyltransferase [Sphingomonas sp.]|uniref:acyltransferase family protein n=1 Tax=Sphingomonas sp. TaxID=28214 RepID=UPI0031D35364
MVVGVQYLRAVAALLVVFVHLQEQLQRAGHAIPLALYGSVGVDIFFVISGFVMWHTSQDHHRTLDFYYRRIIRIVPLYWALTSVVVAMLVLAPSLVRSGKLDWAHVAASYFFVPMAHPVATTSMFPVLVPGWTLNYEMFFYLVFGLALLLPRAMRLAALSVAFGVLAAGYFVVPRGATAASFYTDPIILEFLLGIVLGALCGRGAKLPGWSAALLIVAGVALILFRFEAHRFLRDGIGAAMIVYGAVLFEMGRPVRRRPALMLLGDASYSLYLSHALVLSALFQVMARIVPVATIPGAVVYVLGAIVVSFAIAILLYRYVEKPALRYLKRRGPPDGTAPAG